jgi:hypothetical protein
MFSGQGNLVTTEPPLARLFPLDRVREIETAFTTLIRVRQQARKLEIRDSLTASGEKVNRKIILTILSIMRTGKRRGWPGAFRVKASSRRNHCRMRSWRKTKLSWRRDPHRYSTVKRSAPRPRLKVESIPMRPAQASQIDTIPSSTGMLPSPSHRSHNSTASAVSGCIRSRSATQIPAPLITGRFSSFFPGVNVPVTRTWKTFHQRIHRDQSNLIPLGSRSFHPNGSRTPSRRPLPPKRHGPGWP